MIEDLAKIPLEFSPGEGWNYSVSTDVVGYLIGKISGMPFEQFLKERIFNPLGMNDTDFFVPADKAHRFAACYSAGVQIGMTAGEATLKLQDDPATSSFLSPPSLRLRRRRPVLDRGRLSHLLPGAAQWRRAWRRQAARPEDAEADDVEPSARRRDLPAMSRSLFSEATYNGIGFGLGFAVTMNPAQTLLPGSPGEYLLGRRGDDVVLHRSGGRADHDLHDPGAAVERLSAAARTADPGVFGDHRQQSLKPGPHPAAWSPRDWIASYFSISGTIRRGRNSDTLGQMISAASTSSIGISMITVSLSA